TGKLTTPVRLMAPDTAKDGKPLPLVLVFHGAGASENMCFDAHGPGRVVELARKRGWLVVAPRSGGFGATPAAAEIIEEIGKLYPVDTRRVFAVGHSMGAMQAVSVTSKMPEKFAAVAALSGGGELKPSDALKKLPF